MGCVDTAAEWIHSNWDRISRGADANGSDILYIASAIHEHCQPTLGKFSLNIEEADMVLKEIGGYLLNAERVAARGTDPVIRNRPLKQLTDDLATVRSSLAGLLIASVGSDEQGIVRALYLYGSFLIMAKACSSEDSVGNLVDRDNSMANYNVLSEKGKTNSWVRAGVILVRVLRPNSPMVEDWIPKGTTYWEEL